MKVSELIDELWRQNPDAIVLDTDYKEINNVDTEIGSDFTGLPEYEPGYVIPEHVTPPEEA